MFDLPHIFIVFHYGSGGHFLSSLCTAIVHQKFESVEFTKNGNSHSLAALKDKIEGKEFLSFGTLYLERGIFSSDDDREKYYIKNIESHYKNVDYPLVVCTHDFTNISLYKKYFPNSKILVVTCESIEEQLTAIIMNVKKTFLDNVSPVPLPKKVWNHIINIWKEKWSEELIHIFNKDKVNKIIEDRHNENYMPFIEYASIKKFIEIYKLFTLNSEYNKVVDIKKGKNPVIGEDISVYTKDCIKLPYRYLREDNVGTLIEKLSELFDRNLTDQERDFIVEQFIVCRRSQDQSLLNDPLAYYERLKEKVNNHEVRNRALQS